MKKLFTKSNEVISDFRRSLNYIIIRRRPWKFYVIGRNYIWRKWPSSECTCIYCIHYAVLPV